MSRRPRWDIVVTSATGRMRTSNVMPAERLPLDGRPMSAAGAKELLVV
jgi:hypothetical protein